MNEPDARQSKPVKLAGIPIISPEARRASTGTLRGATALSPAWLPVDGPVGEALAAERAEHLRLLDELRSAADAYRDAEAAFLGEDRDFAQRLRSHARDGGRPPADKRASTADRAARLAALAERVEALALVVAEHVEHTIAVVGQRELEIMAELTGRAAEAVEQRRRAQELLDQARRDEWQLLKLARWTMATADDAPGFGQQPAPVGVENPPRTFTGLGERDLERPWHRPVDPAAEVQAAAAELVARQEQERRERQEDESGDPTGVVFGLDPDTRGVPA